MRQLIVSIEVPLPCGCTIVARDATQTPVGSTPIDPQRVMQALNFGSGTLAYWYRHFAGRHHCHLVTPQNPNGIDPDAPKGAHPAPLRHLSDTELDLLAEVDHSPFIVAANLTMPYAEDELKHLIEAGLIGDPGDTGALVTTSEGKAIVKARR